MKHMKVIKLLNEAMVQVAGKDKPSGAKVLATVICESLVERNVNK